jgi:hypothetical protein
MLPKRTAHHVLPSSGRPTPSERSSDGPSRRGPSAFFFNPAITEGTERAPGVFEDNDQPAADVAGGGRSGAGGCGRRSRQPRADCHRNRGLGGGPSASWLTSPPAAWCRDNDNGTGCVALVALPRPGGRPHGVGPGSLPLHLERRCARGWGCS